MWKYQISEFEQEKFELCFNVNPERHRPPVPAFDGAVAETASGAAPAGAGSPAGFPQVW